MYIYCMILGIIIITAGVLGLGYAMYNSTVERKNNNSQELQHDWYVEEQQPDYPQQAVEDEVDKSLDQLVEHLHAYEQYYEQKVWECHNCMQLAQGCMALEPDSEERLALYQIMKHDVTQFNRYLKVMRPFSRNELNEGWNIALELRNKELLNPDQAALFHKCWEEIVPYAISENYNHITLSNNLEYRAELIAQMKLNVIQRKQQYAETHKEILQWEYEYAHVKGETIMAYAELDTAITDMETADHVLALMLAENENEGGQALVNAYAQAAEQALILKQAEIKADTMEKARLELEKARMDMEADNFEQILIQHHQPGDELHPNLPQGAPIVPGNYAPPPPAGGGWWSNFVEWIWSWFG